MSQKLELTLAMGDYEIVRALKDGTVEPDGIKLNVLTKMDSTTRHWRFLRNQDFDVAECSCSSYLVARDQGMPFEGIPVFLHRRFRHGFMFINTTKGISEPKDLIGCKMGVKQFQSSAQLWMRGILEHEYGVPHRSMEFFSELDESIEFDPPDDLKLTRLPNDKSVEMMLAEGELDAVLHPDLIKPLVEKDPRVGRLFPNFKEEEIAFFERTRIFPIMHVLGIKKEIVEKYPWVPINLYHAFNEAKAIAMKRMVNPRIVPLAWYREAWEEQEEIMGTDPWQYGMTEDNESQLQKLVGYSHEQGMIRREIPLDELFLDMSQGRKRGDVFRV
ncbi:MAG: 4,5-dihydroxyphthalate decarboxylase [Rhodospirillaceae bacterium]|nr:4,5-dihydroxyphthalate decarboxylase [Rhodospirillaceae bacterium]|tara:strand:+ start:2737 stop:3726 length:990 start_codon:yes stop_codon:yes gene_type:complete